MAMFIICILVCFFNLQHSIVGVPEEACLGLSIRRPKNMDESKWSHLPEDILEIIANRLNNDNSYCDAGGVSNIHNLRLRSVCKSWRSFVSLSPPDKDYTLLNHLPAYSIYLLQLKPAQQSLSSWLVKVDKNKNWQPLNQLSSNLNREIGFPNGLPKVINLLNLRITHVHTHYTLTPFTTHDKVVVSTSRQPPIIMASFNCRLWFLEFGDIKWRPTGLGHADFIFHKGNFYVVQKKGSIVMFRGSDLKKVEVVGGLCFPYNGDYDKHFVECNGALYLTVKCVALSNAKLTIFKLNVEEKEMKRVVDLDNHVFFVTDEYSCSISTRDFPSIKTNYIYFHHYPFIHVNRKEKFGNFCDVGVYFLCSGISGPLANFSDQWPLFFGFSNLLEAKALISSKKCRKY